MRPEVELGQVHLFEVLGQHFALDVASGSLHRVDEVAREAIALYPEGHRAVVRALSERFSVQAVEEACQEVQALVETGLLFSPEPVAPVVEEAPLVKALCMNVAHDCDLVCGYCFAGQGNFGGTRSMMSIATAQRTIDWLVGQADSPTLALDFFGGEPLLNLDVIQAAVAHARQWEKRSTVRFNFTVTTNGTKLTAPVREFLDRESFSVVLSVDGRPEVHDRFRKMRDGSGSYARVIHDMRELTGGRAPDTYYVRGTYTRHNLDFAEDVIHLADLGFRSLSLEPVVAPVHCHYALTEADLAACAKEYERLATLYLRRCEQGAAFTFFHFAIDLAHGPCLPKRLRGCGAGTEYLAVDPDGNFYPCHQLVGDEIFRLGSVADGLHQPAVRAQFARTHALAKPECASCWARYHCGGGCHANAYHFNGDIRQPYRIGCELQRQRLQCALYVQANLSVGVTTK